MSTTIDQVKKQLHDVEPKVHFLGSLVSVPITTDNWDRIAQVLCCAGNLPGLPQLLGLLSSIGVEIKDEGLVKTALIHEVAFSLLIPDLVTE